MWRAPSSHRTPHSADCLRRRRTARRARPRVSSAPYQVAPEQARAARRRARLTVADTIGRLDVALPAQVLLNRHGGRAILLLRHHLLRPHDHGLAKLVLAEEGIHEVGDRLGNPATTGRRRRGPRPGAERVGAHEEGGEAQQHRRHQDGRTRIPSRVSTWNLVPPRRRARRAGYRRFPCAACTHLPVLSSGLSLIPHRVATRTTERARVSSRTNTRQPCCATSGSDSYSARPWRRAWWRVS